MVMANSGKQGSFKMVFPNGITAPQPVLAAPPISPAEIQLVSSSSTVLVAVEITPAK